MDDKLPDNIISITTLLINRSKRKHCTCGKPIYEMARDWERFNNDVKRLLEQRKEIVSYKPHLLVIRNLESNYRGGKMLPCCPHCGRGMLLEEISVWTNKEIELQRRKFEQKEAEW